MTKDEVIRRGQAARRVQQEEGLTGLFATLEGRYIEEWKAGESPAERELAWAKARVLDDLKRELQSIADAGTFEEVQIERSKSRL